MYQVIEIMINATSYVRGYLGKATLVKVSVNLPDEVISKELK